MMQYPIGMGDDFEGIIDLVTMRARFFEGPNGEEIREVEIPAEHLENAKELREEMLDAASMFSDDLAEAFLEGEETEELILRAVRRGTLKKKMTPVFLGSAFKNKGVQLLLDAVNNYLPSPNECQNVAMDMENHDKEVYLYPEPELPAVALAFKLDNQQYGQLTYLRIYQGTIKKGDTLVNARTNKKIKVGRLAKMHAQNMEELEIAYGGTIVAIFGVDCALGDTFTSPEVRYTMHSSHVPEPIISLAIKPVNNKDQEAMGKALGRFIKEDPTFRSYVDEETGDTIISGMGELHLNVYIERMRREYKAEIEVGAPKVSYRETITKAVQFEYTHKKQSGGKGQYAKIAGVLSHSGDDENIFDDEIKGGNIPQQFIPGCEKGFERSLKKGAILGYPVVGVKLIIDDGNFHPVDSSQLAFETATWYAFRENYNKAKPRILEPMMLISVETPSEFRGNVMGTINQRRGMVQDTVVDDHFTRIDAEVPLSETFGFATALRSVTQGKSEFTMEFHKYSPLPRSLEEDLIKQEREKEKQN
jgi:elongation factor G